MSVYTQLSLYTHTNTVLGLD